MFRLLAADFTLIHLWLTQHNYRVQVKFNLQPNKSRCLCLLSNNIKMSMCRLARDRSYLGHPYLCSSGVSTGLIPLQDPPVWEGGRNLCRVKTGASSFLSVKGVSSGLTVWRWFLHMDMCTLSEILVQIWSVRAAAVWPPTVLHKQVPTTSQHATGSQTLSS